MGINNPNYYNIMSKKDHTHEGLYSTVEDVEEIKNEQDGQAEHIKKLQADVIANTEQIKLKISEEIYNKDKEVNEERYKYTSSEILALKDSIKLKVEKKDIIQAIDDMEIGTTNIIRNSRNPKDLSHWSVGIGNIELVDSSHFGTAEKFFSVRNATPVEKYAGTKRYKLEGGATYTFSMIVNLENNVSSMDVFLLMRKSDSTSDYDYAPTFIKAYDKVKNKFHRVTGTITIPEDVIDGYVRIDHNSGAESSNRLWFSALKLEKATKPSDWSPAPEDTDEKFKYVTDKIAEITITDEKIISTVKDSKTNGKNTFAQQSDIEQLDTSWTARFSSGGGYNLIYNGDFKNGFKQWVNDGCTIITNSSCPSSLYSVRMGGELGATKRVAQIVNCDFTEKFTVSFWQFTSSSGANGTTNAFRKAEIILYYADGTKGYVGTLPQGVFDTWEKLTLTVNPEKRLKQIGVYLYNRDTTKIVYYSNVMVEKGIMATEYTPNPNEVYDGVTSIDKDGIEVTASNVKSKTQMSADGFKIIKTDNGDELFRVNADGTLTLMGNITATTFSNSTGSFKVSEDGVIDIDTLGVNETISTDVLNVNEISNPQYPKCLEGDTLVYINPSSTTISDVFEDGGIYRSFAELEELAPKNLNGNLLKIRLWENITENVFYNTFCNGYINVEFNGKILRGYIRVIGVGISYKIYGDKTGVTGGTYGHIMPNAGCNRLSYRYGLVAENCDLVVYDMKIYKSVVTDLGSGCILCTDRAKAYIANVVAMNEPTLMLRCHSMSTVYLSGSSGMTTNQSIHAVSGSIITVNPTKQAGRKGSTAHTYTSGNGQIFANGVTWDTTAQNGSNDSSNNNDKVTKTISIKSTLGDTWRNNSGWGWKKDGTVRQGNAYGSGDCNGVWFFGSSLATYLNKDVSKVTISIKRQSGGSSATATHYIVGHNHTSRPSGAPTLSTQITTIPAKIGETITKPLSATEIANLKKFKGIGLKTSYNATNYSVCSGTCTIKITYTE